MAASIAISEFNVSNNDRFPFGLYIGEYYDILCFYEKLFPLHFQLPNYRDAAFESVYHIIILHMDRTTLCCRNCGKVEQERTHIF